MNRKSTKDFMLSVTKLSKSYAKDKESSRIWFYINKLREKKKRKENSNISLHMIDTQKSESITQCDISLRTGNTFTLTIYLKLKANQINIQTDY